MTNIDKEEKKENLFLNLLLNIIIPTIILTKFSGDDHLGAKLGVIIALSFPISYGLYDYFFVTKKINLFSGIGVVSVLLTGGISLLELPPKYIAIKEATIPAVLGLITIISTKTRFPLIKTFIYNERLLQVDKINRILKEAGKTNLFELALVKATYLLALAFAVSSVLNYVLAKLIVVSAPGTEAFNEELGKMMGLSFIVIAVPSMLIMMGALFYLFRQISQLTGLKFEEVIIDAGGNEDKKQ